MLTLVGEHELLLFWIALVVLLGTARALGALMQRWGQPRVVGELAAGVLVGPTVFGRLFPDLAGWLFPGGEVESALLMAVAWLGIVLLLLVTGFETDLALLRQLGMPAVSLSTGSLVLPLAIGFGLGWAMPADLWGAEANRLGFALFIAVALSISALPVIAKIMSEMNLMRRNVGQLTIAAAMANDLVGWLLLGAVVGVFTAGVVDAASLALSFASVLAFLVAALTIGQRFADVTLRRARRAGGFGGALSATLLITFVLGAITQALGVEAVLGALIAGIVLGRSRYQRADVKRSIEVMGNQVFAPIFFATAGLHVDLAVLLEPQALLWTGIVLAAAAVAKLGGSYVGGRLSGLSGGESLAAGIGLNARGAMEIVLATIGLSLGALNETSYAIIVLLAIATSVMAPLLLRPVLRRLQAAPEEAERLQREEMLSRSLIAGASSALLPTRGGVNSAVAARVLDALLQPSASITVLSVRPEAGEPDLEGVLRWIAHRSTDVRIETGDDPAATILEEAALGYGLLTLGLNEDYIGSHELSEPIQRVLAQAPIPLLLVRHREQVRDLGDMEGWGVRRVLLGVTGTRPGRAAEELAYRLSAGLGADVLALHVVTRELTAGGASPAVERHLERVQEVASSFGVASAVAVRHGAVPADELLRAADEWDADTIVLGTSVRSANGRPFLGHGTEWLLEHARQTVLSVVFPAEEGGGDNGHDR
jgi:Kef-type K+ transport system membrane component KefB/nucleotide-binding universal stress UspA family protein